MKYRFLPGVIAGIVTLSFAAHGFAQRAGQSSRVTTGTVTQAARVQLASEAGKGALVGGTLGLVSAKGKSSSKKARNAFVGGLAGGAVARGAQGSREGMSYSVRSLDGATIRIVTDQTEVRVGDCATVEEVGSTANIRRVSGALCDPGSARVREAVDEELQEEAAECAAAKQSLVEAATEEALDLALRKVDILCSN